MWREDTLLNYNKCHKILYMLLPLKLIKASKHINSLQIPRLSPLQQLNQYQQSLKKEQNKGRTQLLHSCRVATRRRSTFNHNVPRSLWYSSEQPWTDDRLS